MSLDVFVRCECGRFLYTDCTDDQKLVIDIEHECDDLYVSPDDFAYLPLLIAGVVVWGVVMVLGSIIGIMKGG